MPYDVIIGRDEADKKRFGEKGLIKIGKGYVKMGTYTSLSNNILLDIARSHVFLITGKRGSGKSYSIGVIAEELANLPDEESKNISSLIFDTMGIFWTMRFKNDKEKELLQEWDLKTQSLDIKIFIPFGYFDEYKEKLIPADERFSIRADDLDIDDWILTFGLGMINPIAILIEKAVAKLKEDKKQKKISYGIDDIIQEISSAEGADETKNIASGLFEAAKTWGIFTTKGEEGTKIKDLNLPGKTSVIDLSMYSSVGSFNVRALVIGLISKKIFNERMMARKIEEVQAVQHGMDYLSYKQKREMPLTWIFVDEAHEFLPQKGKTSATDALIQILREGRQPGLSLVLATQQPGKIHTDVMTQSDVVISHRVTSKQDLDALNLIMQSYALESIKQQIDDLPNLKGSAIILDDNSERIYPMRVRPRFSWHGGEAPTAVKAERRI
ncbi:hypothetical protein COV15_01465 [Candidatus Woesearchaeota archaeon CG10_big_fil_rev_8_21_14_0_10_34_12]|nr:MAG: hypothetical protein COV15_01465 [Candidatus Woesearchaeota archaeon CG10_big_fil_rev_8_21_14_0_10_34_12]